MKVVNKFRRLKLSRKVIYALNEYAIACRIDYEKNLYKNQMRSKVN